MSDESEVAKIMQKGEMRELALSFATRYHEGQIDKTGKPYIEHPIAVAEMCHRDYEKVVALLHDVLEDTEATESDLSEAGFPDYIVRACKALHHDKQTSYEDYLRAIRIDPIASRVKRADIVHNSDPERLALLPADERKKLNEKYTKALELLSAQVSGK